jgi:acylphosphatase
MDNIRVRLIIQGRVQGVWFRDSTRREAMSLGVNGWVKNCRDGSVEVLAEGPEERVNPPWALLCPGNGCPSNQRGRAGGV